MYRKDEAIRRGRRKIMKRKMARIIIVIAALAVITGLFGPAVAGRIRGQDVVTSSQLVKAVDISRLSTAEFAYNGIAEKYKDCLLYTSRCV